MGNADDDSIEIMYDGFNWVITSFPKPVFTPAIIAKAGRMAINAKKKEPGNVIFESTPSMKSAVCFPGRRLPVSAQPWLCSGTA